MLVARDPAGQLLMVRRPADGLLGGLREFPAVEIEAEDYAPKAGAQGGKRGRALELGPALRVETPLYDRCRGHLEELGVRLVPRGVRFDVLPQVRHAFTHFKAVYHPMLVEGSTSVGLESEGPAREGRKWASPEQLEDLPLPVAQRRILDLARSAVAKAAVARVAVAKAAVARADLSAPALKC